LLREVVHRLRVPRPLGTKQASEGAANHGSIRRSQGYSIPMSCRAPPIHANENHIPNATGPVCTKSLHCIG
jgi:hypothetical protein